MSEALRGCEGRAAAGIHERPRRAGHAILRAHVTAPGIRSAAVESAQQEPDTWLEELRSEGPERDEAIGRLHALMLRGARFEVMRRARSVPHLRGGDLDDVALQSANDALVAVLAKLDTFRGDSRFTTWVFKFALLEAAVKLRRRAWQGREVPLAPEDWSVMASDDESIEAGAESREALRSIKEAIDSELSPHQREVLLAVTLNDVPIDVMAERLDTTRGALYKTIHDARKKLRSHLTELETTGSER